MAKSSTVQYCRRSLPYYCCVALPGSYAGKCRCQCFSTQGTGYTNREVIVDNDISSEGSELIISGLSPEIITGEGFLKRDTLFNNENPFLLGSHMRFQASKSKDQFVDYIPNIHSYGYYAVYVSYQQSDQNISGVKYTVNHSGGKTEFLVNQKMGGGTWIYLGTFHFKQGKHPDQGAVRISAQSNEEGWITTDAIRFWWRNGQYCQKTFQCRCK
jgi:hypothetical protein